jgi:protein-tyrosine kinase
MNESTSPFTTKNSVQEDREAFNLPDFGTVGKREGSSPGGKGDGPVLWMKDPRERPSITDSFRDLKNSLYSLKQSQGMKTFLLTGADSQVGASTVVSNLALLLAWDYGDQRILLVDSDLRSPCLHSAFNLSLEPGLMNCLVDGLSLSQTIRKTFLPNLDIVTSGKMKRQVTSPFDLQTFSSFLKEIREQYDFVVMDSAPLLRSSNTRIISNKADGVVVVTEAYRTRYQVVNNIKEQIGGDSNLVGLVLNKRQFLIPRCLYRFI